MKSRSKNYLWNQVHMLHSFVAYTLIAALLLTLSSDASAASAKSYTKNIKLSMSVNSSSYKKTFNLKKYLKKGDALKKASVKAASSSTSVSDIKVKYISTTKFRIIDGDGSSRITSGTIPFVLKTKKKGRLNITLKIKLKKSEESITVSTPAPSPSIQPASSPEPGIIPTATPAVKPTAGATTSPTTAPKTFTFKDGTTITIGQDANGNNIFNVLTLEQIQELMDSGIIMGPDQALQIIKERWPQNYAKCKAHADSLNTNLLAQEYNDYELFVFVPYKRNSKSGWPVINGQYTIRATLATEAELRDPNWVPYWETSTPDYEGWSEYTYVPSDWRNLPTTLATEAPTASPTMKPTASPTAAPSIRPITTPTTVPTIRPVTTPTAAPTADPFAFPLPLPSGFPFGFPTAKPTATPTIRPTAAPTVRPTAAPTSRPAATPTIRPTATPTTSPVSATLTEETVYNRIMAMQSRYPTGTPWTNSNYYRWSALGIWLNGYGCVAFACMLSDAGFGESLPAREIKSPAASTIRVGDIIRINNDTHSAIVIGIDNTSFTLAEGNVNSAVYWGRKIPKTTKIDYVWTRW